MSERKAGEWARRGNVQQQALPSKACVACGRVFVWRKKWARDWEQVKYCSKACAKRGGGGDAKTPRGQDAKG